MKRYYIADVIGSGTYEDPYRSSVVDPVLLAGKPTAAVIPIRSDGTPVHAWCLTLVGGTDHSALRSPQAAQRGVDPLPDLSIGAPIPAAAQPGLRAILQRRGLDPALAENPGDIRGLVAGLGRRLDPRFDESALDVLDPDVTP